MKDYKKRYKEALSQAKKELKCCGSLDCDAARQIFRLFPELKESEDERIRKQLLNWFKDCNWDAIDNETLKRDDIIAWLEKQGEQKPAETRKFKVGNVVKYNGTEYKITAVESNGYRVYALTYDEDAASLISFSAPAILVEQKPAWSEEDEIIKQDIENLLHFALIDGSAVSPAAHTTKEEAISWLKSLKERYTWRPSDNELEVLRLAAEKDGACLMGLYEQLKKLKG